MRSDSKLNDEVLATIWYQIMNTAPFEHPDLGQWLRDERDTDILPQPGYVGANYRPGGTLLVAQNPGMFRGSRLDADDDPYYTALTNMKEAVPDKIAAFHNLNRVYAAVAPYWHYYKKVLKPVFDALKLTLPDVAHINLVKWRSKSYIRKALYDLSWRSHTCAQLRELAPGFIVALGEGTKKALCRRYTGTTEIEVVPRTFGDKYDSPGKLAGLRRLEQHRINV